MRLAHLILAHAYPKQLQRLISRLQHQEADIYIQLDSKSDMLHFSFLGEMKQVTFIKKRTIVRWGTFSIVRATLDAMQEILDTGINYSHINLLSAQDYPLKSAEEIHQFLYANSDTTYMHSLKIDTEWTEAMDRVQNYNFGDYHFPGHYVLQHIVRFSGLKKPTPKSLTPYGRSQWLTITPECVRYVIDYLNTHPAEFRFFRMSFAPDEFVFQTILNNSPLKHKLVNDNLRYIDFPFGTYHPKMLTAADAQALTNSGKFYARKFSPDVDPIILNYLDWIADAGSNPDLKENKHIKYIFERESA